MSYDNLDIDRFTSLKPMSSYPKNVLNELLFISFVPGELSTPFGSYVYRLQKYPGDIDTRQIFKSCCSVDDVVRRFAKELQRVVKNILDTPEHYFSEVKAGLDSDYDIQLGKISNGTWYPDRDLLAISEELYNEEKLNEVEY